MCPAFFLPPSARRRRIGKASSRPRAIIEGCDLLPDNGGSSLPDQKEDDIEAVLGQDWDRPTGAGVGRVSHDQTTATNLYIDHLVATIAPLNDDKTQPKPLKGLKIVADCAMSPAPCRCGNVNASPDG